MLAPLREAWILYRRRELRRFTMRGSVFCRTFRMSSAELSYQTGFGNDFASEALPGALPIGQSNPQKPAYGLYTEEINGTPFTAPRGAMRRCWTYRIRPSAVHEPYRELPAGLLRSAPFDEAPA